MEKYHFFSSSARPYGFIGGSLSELRRDESEAEGVLASVLKVLKRVHQMFFDPDEHTNISSRDVRQLTVILLSNKFLEPACAPCLNILPACHTTAGNRAHWELRDSLP
ncbi:hypothetical protein ACLOJK_019450 [Asimina triloba]